MGEQFDKSLKLSELDKAARQTKSGVMWKDGVASFNNHRLLKCYQIKEDVLNGRYKLRPGTIVKIYYPKKREALAPWYRDRVLQRSFCNNGIYHDLTNSLIYDNVACQVGKGTDLSVNRTICFLERLYRIEGNFEGYGVHLDVKKYFPSTPHKAIKELDRKLIKDEKFIPFTDEIIDGSKDTRPPEEIAKDPFGERGTGLGSQMNQLNQVALLTELDHKLKTFCRFYQRYNDDFLILDKSKEVIEKAVQIVETELEKYGLQMVNKAGIFPISKGFYFLKLHFIPLERGRVVVMLSPNALAHERHQLRNLKELVDKGERTMKNVHEHYQAFVNYSALCSSDAPVREMDKFYARLFREKPKYKYKKRRKTYGKDQKAKSASDPGGEDPRTRTSERGT